MKDMLQPNSNTSSIRFAMLSCVYAAIGLAFYGMYKNLPLTELSVFCGTFLTTGFAAKVVQKRSE